MARYIFMDQFHVTVSAPTGLKRAQYTAIRRVLRDRRIRAGLRDVVRDAFARRRGLTRVQVTASS